MIKEWSTFMDGNDCRDCVSCEKEVIQLKKKNQELKEKLTLTVEKLSDAIETLKRIDFQIQATLNKRIKEKDPKEKAVLQNYCEAHCPIKILLDRCLKRIGGVKGEGSGDG